jgi:SAM-dependent methyltransferase
MILQSLPDLFRKAGIVATARIDAVRDMRIHNRRGDPNYEELKKLYGLGYFNGEEYLDYKAEAESLRLNFRRRIEVLKKLMPTSPRQGFSRLVAPSDISCRRLVHTFVARRGNDISADAVAHAVREQRVNAHEGDYLDFQLENPVDLIAMWDTIEHLRRPDLVIAKAARDLKPGGMLAITTGDIDSLNARLRGRRWRMIHPPTPLHYFSVDTARGKWKIDL